MLAPIRTVSDLGLVLRAVRKSQGVRLDDVAGSAGVGHVFVRDVEHGKETVQMGRVLKLLAEIGIALSIEVPADALPQWEKLKSSGLRPLKARASAGAALKIKSSDAP